MATTTFGLGGFGLLIAPIVPCRAMVTEDDELVIAHGTTPSREVARFTPGDSPASANATWLTPKFARFGEGGPTLSLEDDVVFEDVFLQIDIGVGDTPWIALGPGFTHDLPRGLVLVPAAPDDEDPFFELHLFGGQQEFIRFQKHAQPAASLQLRPAPYQRLLAQDHLKVHEADGSIRQLGYTEVAYEVDGVAWKQVMIAAPLRETTSMLVSAQARAERANDLFSAAGKIAATLGPLGGG